MLEDRLFAPTYDAATLAALPDFWTCVTQQAQGVLTIHATLPGEIHYLSNMRRWTMSQMTMALHFEHQLDRSRPQLSPKMLLTALGDTKVASRNTVQVFIAELAQVRLTTSPPPNTVRQHIAHISEKAEMLMRVYLGIHLQALDGIDNSNRSTYLAENPRFLPYLQPRFARRICASAPWYDPPAELRPFSHSRAGTSILHTLVLATQNRDADASERIGIGTLRVQKMSQSYDISTAHIARILNKVQNLGLIGWTSDGQRGDRWLSDRLRRSYLLWQAEKLAVLSVAFRDAQAAFEKA